MRARPIPAMSASDIERFWALAKRGDVSECWEWKGARARKGYGQFHMADAMYSAHRVSMFLAGNEPSAEEQACHRCDNPCCVNPAHLFRGTGKENVSDSVRKGRRKHLVGEKHNRSKLTDDQARLALWMAEHGQTHRAIAAELGVSRPTITALVSGRNWKHMQRAL